MNGRKPLIAGNWKMNLRIDESVRLVEAIADEVKALEGVDVLVAPPFTSLHAVKTAMGGAPLWLGAQNMHWGESGAYTGEVSGRMLLEAGCSHVILGHSERRALFGETDAEIDRKAGAAVSLGLAPVLCIGETLEEREAGRTFAIIGGQLEGSLRRFKEDRVLPSTLVLAYEPVWAIGTGRTATPDQAQEVHGFIRQWLEKTFGRQTASVTRILYGGSVKPDNSAELMARPDIDGALVGGASLKVETFLPII